MTIPLDLLLVEDSADDAELVLLALRRGGYQVRPLRVDTAAAMSAALAAGPWDLVLSDYQIPGFGGGLPMKRRLLALECSGASVTRRFRRALIADS